MHIVTSGYPFGDIDMVGAAVGYAELLNVQGEQAAAVTTAPLNRSVTPALRALGAPLLTEYKPASDDVYTLVDISIPDFVEKFVDLDRVVGVIDHHPGYESLWADRIGAAAQIEPVGAACTLVYERWRTTNRLHEMSLHSAQLLMAGILDNTLDFKAGVTTDRDSVAYQALAEHVKSQLPEFPDDWDAQYFRDCERSIFADLPRALRNDTKEMKTTEHLPAAFGQLVVWNAQDVLTNSRAVIAATLGAIDTDWVLNLVSIEEGKSYFLADNPATQKKFGELMGLDMVTGLAVADRLWLRKEVLKRSIERVDSSAK